jgi:hypothetical protein
LDNPFHVLFLQAVPPQNLVREELEQTLAVVKLSQNCVRCSKDRRKRRAKALGSRWETFTIDEAGVKQQIVEVVFDFVDDHDLDELILDNTQLAHLAGMCDPKRKPHTKNQNPNKFNTSAN